MTSILNPRNMNSTKTSWIILGSQFQKIMLQWKTPKSMPLGIGQFPTQSATFTLSWGLEIFTEDSLKFFVYSKTPPWPYQKGQKVELDKRMSTGLWLVKRKFYQSSCPHIPWSNATLLAHNWCIPHHIQHGPFARRTWQRLASSCLPF